ncbi:hypothetical protein D3C87_1133920 [compost metagenome]
MPGFLVSATVMKLRAINVTTTAPYEESIRLTIKTIVISTPYPIAEGRLTSSRPFVICGKSNPISIKTNPFNIKQKLSQTFTPRKRDLLLRKRCLLFDKSKPPLTTARTPEQ